MAQQNKNQPKAKTGLARCLELASGHKGLVFLSGFLAALAAICSFVPYLSIYYIIREILFVYPDMSLLNVSTISTWGWLALVGILGNIVFYFFALLCSHIAAFGTLYELKVAFADHIMHIPLGYHLTLGSGKLRKIMDENIESVEKFIAHQLPDFVASLVAPLVLVIILLGIDWRYGVVCLVGIVLAFIVQFAGFNGEAKEKMHRFQTAQENMNSASVEYVRGMPEIKAFNQTASSMGRFQSAVLKVRDITTKWYKHCWPFMSISQAILPSSIAFVLPVGMALISGGAVSLAELIVCILLSMAIVGSLQNFTEFWESFAVISEVQPRIQALLDMEELTEPAQPKHTDKADMQMKDVHFGYGDSEIIHGISFTAKAGSVTAFVGPSGSGKSTLAKLIARFWDVDAGAVLVGGIDIREMSLTDLTEKISYVSQDNFLFNMSLRDNIRIGKPEATDKEVEWAAAQAGCDEFISRFPQGYDTNAGDAGARLSGGERQRLAIARAILKNAPIVILDEATAFTDPENEDKLQRSIDKLTKGKTLIVIAHRLSTIMYADQILVLENGQITAQGTHEQLLTHSETYLDMWKAHISAMDWSMNQEVSELC